MGQFKKREVVTLETLPDYITNAWNWWMLCDIACQTEPVQRTRQGRGEKLVYNVKSRYGNIRVSLRSLGGGSIVINLDIGRSFRAKVETTHEFVFSSDYPGADSRTRLTQFDLIGDTTFEDVEDLMVKYSLTKSELIDENTST